MGEVVQSYEYRGPDGMVLFIVDRYEPKAFRQRRPVADGYVSNLEGVERVPYRLPELIAGIGAGRGVWLTEGEKDADALAHLGLVATTLAGGAGKWRPEYACWFEGASVSLVVDWDEPGRRGAAVVVDGLELAGAKVELMRAAHGKDVSDHLSAGGSIEDLIVVDRAELEVSANGVGEHGDDDEPATTWEFPEWGPVLDRIAAGERPPLPTLGRRADGQGLFYAGRVNGIAGESGSAKSWLALACCAQEMAAGHHCGFIDFESRPFDIAGRLLALGVTPRRIETYFHYTAPSGGFGPPAAAALADVIDAHTISLWVIDSTGEALAVAGVNPNADEEVARWFRTYPRLLADTGAGVVGVDHVVKNRDERGLWAIGSQRKRAAISGAAYMVDVLVEFGKGRRGEAKLICAKDREGNYIRGQVAAHYTMDATGSELLAFIEAPDASDGESGKKRPTVLMGRVCDFLGETDELISARVIEQNVVGNNDWKRVALKVLVEEGYVERVTGRGGRRYRLIRPFDPDATIMAEVPDREPAEVVEYGVLDF